MTACKDALQGLLLATHFALPLVRLFLKVGLEGFAWQGYRLNMVNVSHLAVKNCTLSLTLMALDDKEGLRHAEGRSAQIPSVLQLPARILHFGNARECSRCRAACACYKLLTIRIRSCRQMVPDVQCRKPHHAQRDSKQSKYQLYRCLSHARLESRNPSIGACDGSCRPNREACKGC